MATRMKRADELVAGDMVVAINRQRYRDPKLCKGILRVPVLDRSGEIHIRFLDSGLTVKTDAACEVL